MALSIKTMNFDHLIGQTVGTARLLKMLDGGAMSMVFVAYQTTLKRQIAVKILPRALMTPHLAEFSSKKPNRPPSCRTLTLFKYMKWVKPKIFSISPCS